MSFRCSDSSAPNRGFGGKSGKNDGRKGKVAPGKSQQAPGLSSKADGGTKYVSYDDLEFEQRLQAVKKSAIDRRKVEEVKEYGAIDYDAAPEVKSEKSAPGPLTVIGVGAAVVSFGLVFALGDFIPSGSFGPTQEASIVKGISEEERKNLEEKLRQFEEALVASPEDSVALEGASMTLMEMGESQRALTLLEDSLKRMPNNPDAFCLLGEVKYELKDYEGSILAYRNAERAAGSVDFEILRGLTNSLLANNKPDEAVKLLLTTRDRLNNENSMDNFNGRDRGNEAMTSNTDPVQVELLLGKAYSAWGHISDAISVYDQLISNHPDDFGGYLAKGVLLQQNGNSGDAERMFIQARFFAPDKAKALVDKYSR